MLLFKKNVNIFTIYVTKQKCTCNLLTGIDWGLESLYQEVNVYYIFIYIIVLKHWK